MVCARWGVVLERTVRELQDMPCVDMEAVAPAKKEIASTRSFGRPVTQLEDLIEAVTEFTQRAAEKLRWQNSVAGQVAVFVHTSPHRIEQPQYSRATVVPLRKPTADTCLLVQAAVRGMRAIYRPGFNMAKAGVHLLDLFDGSIEQDELDLDACVEDRTHLMTAMDALNRRYGRGTVALASAGTLGPRRTWTCRRGDRTWPPARSGRGRCRRVLLCGGSGSERPSSPICQHAPCVRQSLVCGICTAVRGGYGEGDTVYAGYVSI